MNNPRMRLKLIVSNATGSLGFVLRLFPNALTFIGYPSQEQLGFIVAASAALAAFGISTEITPSN